jgi:hypothetical protein
MLHQVQITLSEAGEPLSAVLIVNWDEPGEQVAVVPVGPFDTPADVLATALGKVDTQLRLW